MYSSRFRIRTSLAALAMACALAVSSVAMSAYRFACDLGHSLLAVIAPPMKGAPLLLKLAGILQSMKAQAVSPSKPVVLARWRMCPSV